MKQTKLSKQQKRIIKVLGKEAKKHRGVNTRDLNYLIANGKLSDTKRASISRSTKRLINRKLVYRRKSYYSDTLESRIKCNVLFASDKGKREYNKLETVNKKNKRKKS